MIDINIGGIVSHSTVDYPKKSASVVYLCGCPFRCPWCQNPELVFEKNCKKVDIQEIVDELKRNFLIDAVCVTGGEPLMQDATILLLKKIKEETNLFLKIDTNGYFPERLEKAIGFLDFLTTDIKAPLDEKYGFAVGLASNWKQIVERVRKSYEIICGWRGKKEARTTIVPELVDSEEDIFRISEIVKKFKFNMYTLQQFRPDKTLDPEYEKKTAPSYEKMRKLGKTAKENLPDTLVQIVTDKKGFETIGFETIEHIE